MGPENDENQPVKIRTPQIKDGNQIYHLVKKSKPLDINSLYSYLLICTHFDETSAVAEWNNKIIGFIFAYINPHQENNLFIWQVAVLPTMRGQGLATQMIEHILHRKETQSIEFIETTVTPTNDASMALFKNIAANLDTNLEKTSFFTRELFGNPHHEEELLLQIGPLNNK